MTATATATGSAVASAAPPVAAPAFDVLGALPTGTTALEASAGTGKTYTIAALAARYVAEGHTTLAELMLVTFGREATRELRERVRERLVAVERALTDGDARGDAVTALVLAVGADERARRRARLAHALAHFDEATIATTHQFCQDMLAGLGVAGDTDADARFVEQIDDVVVEVVDDFYVRAYAPPTAGAPPFDRDTALALGRAAVNDPGARIAPAEGETTGEADVRARFARGVRGEVERRKRTRRLFTFDDMLTRLHAALTDPRLGETACERLRSRYRVVLVDEFQDTDPTQWDILRTAFHGHAVLTVIGDPKQAIYAFRGADVVSYLTARGTAGTRATLGTNHRSDAPLLAALDRVLGGAALGDDRIVVHPVAAAHEGRRLAGAPVDTPFRLRVVPRTGLRSNWRTGLPEIGPVRRRVAADLAADVGALLAARSTWNDEPLAPGHVAVLVRTNAQADLVREALADTGVPAVLAGAAGVFSTPAAREWLTLLEALEQPGRALRVRAAALTSFVGTRAVELDADPDTVLDRVGQDLRRWAAVLRDRGVAAMVEALSARTGLVPRVLGLVGGERLLTDLRHVGQLLHAEGAAHRHGVVALTEWLRLRVLEAEGGGERSDGKARRRAEARPERTRRLESDADAVQILTVHKCKGLEFPVVYVPFGWDRWVPGEPREVLHHDASGARVRAVGGPGDPAWLDHQHAQRAEDDGEDLRLLYVALTRARSQVVAWWAPSSQTASSALNRLLRSRRGPAGWEPDPAVTLTDDSAVREELAAFAGPDLAVELVEERSATPYMPDAVPAGSLTVARFDRPLDLDWRRSSYSSLTADAHAAGPDATSEPEEAVVTDEADVEVEPTDAGGVGSPMADLPVGAAFGVVVHSVLETVDTTAADLRAALRASAAAELGHRPVSGLDAEVLAAALEPALRTPIDPAGWSYGDVAPRDRLPELGFELPLAGGDRPDRDAAAVTLGGAADLLREHLPADDPLVAYPDALAALPEQVLRGYLTGSVDAVLRAPDGRYVIVDHKTNWLGPVSATGVADPLTTAHYGPEQMRTAMVRAHYPLQALLYGVALHRYLRWRLRGYDPATHLGGTAYLFLRGMCGPDTPVIAGTTCGVFRWTPPPALLVALSDLLAGGPS